MAVLPAGWSEHHVAGGVVLLVYVAWPSAPRPWVCFLPCPAAPDPSDPDVWSAWVERQVEASAATGDGIVVSIDAPSEGPGPGPIVALVAIDAGSGGASLLQRWSVVPDPHSGATMTMLAVAGVGDRAWPDLRDSVGQLLAETVSG